VQIAPQVVKLPRINMPEKVLIDSYFEFPKGANAHQFPHPDKYLWYIFNYEYKFAVVNEA